MVRAAYAAAAQRGGAQSETLRIFHHEEREAKNSMPEIVVNIVPFVVRSNFSYESAEHTH
jgi:hypothetical protein